MQTVYLVYKNNDMTEGRGPMVLVKCFSELELAETFLKDKYGIMGTPLGKGKTNYRGDISYSGAWEIRPTPVLTEVLTQVELEELQRLKADYEKEISRIEKLLT